KKLGTKEPLSDTRITHDICPDCRATFGSLGLRPETERREAIAVPFLFWAQLPDCSVVRVQVNELEDGSVRLVSAFNTEGDQLPFLEDGVKDMLVAQARIAIAQDRMAGVGALARAAVTQ